MGIDFAHFGLQSGMVLRELWKCMKVLVISIPMNKKEKVNYANLKWILRNLSVSILI